MTDPERSGQPLAIDVRGLGKRFGARQVVNGVSLAIETGEIAGFLGANGSGKTTCIRMLCGLLIPDAGSGTVLGRDLRREARAIKHQIGYMTQRFSLYEDLSVAENLHFVAGLYGLDRTAVTDSLANLGLTNRRNQLAGTLSGGWKQRLALAACIIHRPRLLLLDEPTAGVDPKARRDFWDEIHALAASGLTVLVSTHYMDEAERCHRIHYLAQGRLVAVGTVEELIASAGLTTFSVTAQRPAELVARLHDAPGVEQVAPFGTTLHVTGSDAELLAATLRSVGISAQRIPTALEDVFICLMRQYPAQLDASPAGGGTANR